MTNVLLMIALIGQPKLSQAGCAQVVDMLIEIEVKEIEKDSSIRPSEELKIIKKWARDCRSHWLHYRAALDEETK